MNARDNHNNTPLHLAAWQDSLRVATLLVEEGANVTLKGHFGRTPLQHAARFDSINVAKLLLNKSCDEMNAGNKNNNTPLMVAKLLRSEKVLKLFQTGPCAVI